MSNSSNKPEIKERLHKRGQGLIVIILNLVLLSCAILFYTMYTSAYEKRLNDENLGNIANMNRSAAMNATALIESMNIKLDDLAQYVKKHALDLEGALEMIDDANSSSERYFELIG
ncbi:MAG: hypothetical protein PHI27_02180 [Eubacteriales bacterium]|nr:hypothetical protein [Eubacteriales bacterium]MDD3881041.1 hypothetical protein [Eubacteriales bacterium]MDD4511890.1 hypothetical protein [Eubacteriales bacterium]